MKKEGVNTYKGIDYVLLSSLSTEQAESLKLTLTEHTLIKIQINETIITDCVLYSAYELWFNSQVESPKLEIKKEEVRPNFTHEPLPAA